MGILASADRGGNNRLAERVCWKDLGGMGGRGEAERPKSGELGLGHGGNC